MNELAHRIGFAFGVGLAATVIMALLLTVGSLFRSAGAALVDFFHRMPDPWGFVSFCSLVVGAAMFLCALIAGNGMSK